MAPHADRQQQIAARNVEAILDAAEQLLGEGAAASVAAVAARSRLSRVTVYAHFATREELLEAVVRRSVDRSRATLRTAAEGGGPARERLMRVLSASWAVIQRQDAIARAASRELPSSSRTRAHAHVLDDVADVIREGQGEGTIRGDLDPGWLANVLVALIHAAAEQVQAGALGEQAARTALTATADAVLDTRD